MGVYIDRKQEQLILTSGEDAILNDLLVKVKEGKKEVGEVLDYVQARYSHVSEFLMKNGKDPLRAVSYETNGLSILQIANMGYDIEECNATFFNIIAAEFPTLDLELFKYTLEQEVEEFKQLKEKVYSKLKDLKELTELQDHDELPEVSIVHNEGESLWFKASKLDDLIKFSEYITIPCEVYKTDEGYECLLALVSISNVEFSTLCLAIYEYFGRAELLTGADLAYIKEHGTKLCDIEMLQKLKQVQ